MPDWRYDYDPDSTPTSNNQRLKDWRQQETSSPKPLYILRWLFGSVFVAIIAVLVVSIVLLSNC